MKQQLHYRILKYTLLLCLCFIGNSWGQTAQPLPYDMSNSAGIADLTSANGWVQTGIGANYSSSGSNIKFDTQLDEATLYIADIPDQLTFNLKGNGLSGSYVFDMLESSNGTDFSVSLSITTGIGTTNTVFTKSLSAATRYIKWRYTTKATGNVGFGGVHITGGAIPSAPTIITNNATDITSNGVTLNGSVNANNIATTAIHFEFGLNDSYGTSIDATPNTLSNNADTPISATIAGGLSDNTVYHYRAVATADGEPVNGPDKTFTTADIEAPVAAEASDITATGFTASWEAVDGATGYQLDVYTAGAAASDLFISEYVEGSSNNKYIEIYNGTGATVDLSDYELQVFANGSATAGTTSALSGTLANNTAIVYKNSDAIIYTGTAITNGATNYNGDDAVALHKVSTDSYVDIFGRIGEDPGAEWTADGGYSTVNKTLVRKASVSGGITTNPSSGFPTLATEWDVFDIDDISHLGTHVSDGGSSFVPGYENLAVESGTSQEVEGLATNTTYSYRVRATSSNSTSGNSNVIEVTTAAAITNTTWDGAEWSNGAPTSDTDAIIAGDFNTADNGAITAKSLTVDSGTITVATGTTVNITGAVTNNAAADNFIVQSDANLYQPNADAGNIGNITINRNSALLYRQDYTLWSSPVAGQNLRSFSPNTIYTRFSGYTTPDPDNFPDGGYVQLLFDNDDILNTLFDPGQGYLIRMPNDWTEYVDDDTPGTPYQGTFVGLPNNQDTDVTLSTAGNGYNLVGNPYPSPINIADFFTANPDITKTLWFWRKRNGTAGSGYATSNEAGVVSSDDQPELNDVVINGTIRTGQGFFVQSVSGDPQLHFNNGMRVTDNTPGFFFRNGSTETVERNRIWLNLSNDTDVVGQMLLAYMTGATTGIDNGIDGKYFNDSPVALTSVIDNGEYVIQGRSLPFAATDIVPLSFKTDVAGSYSIALHNTDGLFAGSQDILLKDNLINTVHDLKDSAYTFTSETGTFANRFEVVYQTPLGINDPTLTPNSIVIYKQNGILNIDAGQYSMDKVQLFDISGRLIYTLDQIGSTTAKIAGLSVANQVLVVKITTAENGIVSKKVIY
jgi:hypothetical protein